MKPDDLQGRVITKEALDQVIDIVDRATNVPLPLADDRPAGVLGKMEEWNRQHKWKMLWCALSAFLMLPLLVALQPFIGKEVIFPVAAVCAVIAIGAAMTSMVLDIVPEIPGMSRFFRQPYPLLIEAVRMSAHLYLPYLDELVLCDRNAVQYLLRHYQYRRNALEKRGAVIAGSIDKIGLFPAAAAVALLWGSLAASPLGTWLTPLPALIFAFHLLNLWSFEVQQRMDRIISLLEQSLVLIRAE